MLNLTDELSLSGAPQRARSAHSIRMRKSEQRTPVPQVFQPLEAEAEQPMSAPDTLKRMQRTTLCRLRERGWRYEKGESDLLHTQLHLLVLLLQQLWQQHHTRRQARAAAGAAQQELTCALLNARLLLLDQCLQLAATQC